jgi:hypothetical protein
MHKKDKQSKLITTAVVIFAVIMAFALFLYLVLPYFLE